MSNTFLLPDLGEGLTEADIVRWLVAEGDTVAVDQPMVEVETAKALVEVPSPYAGTVLTLHGAEGETMDVGSPLITIGAAGALVGRGLADLDRVQPGHAAARIEAGDPHQAAVHDHADSLDGQAGLADPAGPQRPRHGDAGVVAGLGVQTREVVEDRRLATVGRADQSQFG